MTPSVTSTCLWHAVCAVDALPRERGVAALVAGVQVAVFTVEGASGVFVVDNVDPFTGVGCLSRGLVGDAGGELMVVSPMHKQRFSLRSGVCLDDPDVRVGVYETRVREGMLEVLLP